MPPFSNFLLTPRSPPRSVRSWAVGPPNRTVRSPRHPAQVPRPPARAGEAFSAPMRVRCRNSPNRSGCGVSHPSTSRGHPAVPPRAASMSVRRAPPLGEMGPALRRPVLLPPRRVTARVHVCRPTTRDTSARSGRHGGDRDLGQAVGGLFRAQAGPAQPTARGHCLVRLGPSSRRTARRRRYSSSSISPRANRSASNPSGDDAPGCAGDPGCGSACGRAGRRR